MWEDLKEPALGPGMGRSIFLLLNSGVVAQWLALRPHKEVGVLARSEVEKKYIYYKDVTTNKASTL